MKFIFILPLMIFMNVSYGQSNLDELFKDFKQQGDNFNIELDGDILKWKDEKTSELQTQIDKIRLIIFEKGKCLDKSTYQKVKDIVRRESFEDLLYARDGKEKVEVFAKESGEYITDLFLLITTEDQSIILNISGKIKLDELKKLDMNMKGFDKLKNLYKKA